MIAGHFTNDVQQSREIYEKRTNERVETARNAMQNVPRDLWKCDPKIHKKGKTYDQITNFLQGYVQNEADLNRQRVCGRDCVEYTFAKSYDCSNQTGFCGRQQNCNGNILDCKFIDADMWICNAVSDSVVVSYLFL